MAGYVTHLAFYETHMTSSTCTPCLFASTKGSVMIRYSITLPPPRDRNVVLNKAVDAGKCSESLQVHLRIDVVQGRHWVEHV